MAYLRHDQRVEAAEVLVDIARNPLHLAHEDALQWLVIFAIYESPESAKIGLRAFDSYSDKDLVQRGMSNEEYLEFHSRAVYVLGRNRFARQQFEEAVALFQGAVGYQVEDDAKKCIEIARSRIPVYKAKVAEAASAQAAADAKKSAEQRAADAKRAEEAKRKADEERRRLEEARRRADEARRLQSQQEQRAEEARQREAARKAQCVAAHREQCRAKCMGVAECMSACAAQASCR